MASKRGKREEFAATGMLVLGGVLVAEALGCIAAGLLAGAWVGFAAGSVAVAADVAVFGRMAAKALAEGGEDEA